MNHCRRLPKHKHFGALREVGKPAIENRLQPLAEHEIQTEDRNLFPWYDLTCGTCCSIIATIQIVPDDKRVEASAAITDTPVQP